LQKKVQDLSSQRKLSGAHLSLGEVLELQLKKGFIPQERLFASMTSNPAKLFDTKRFGFLKKGLPANMISLNENHKIKDVYLKGTKFLKLIIL